MGSCHAEAASHASAKNADAAAGEPLQPVADVVLPRVNPTTKLCIAATLAFPDGALVRTRMVLS